MEHGPQLADMIQWAFEGIVTGCAVILVKEIGALKSSIDKLNQTMAKVLERLSWHEKEIDRLDDRLDKLEAK